MLEAGARARFAQESMPLGRASQRARPQQLQRDGPPELPVPRSIDDAHPPGTDLFEDVVAGDAESTGRRRRQFVGGPIDRNVQFLGHGHLQIRSSLPHPYQKETMNQVIALVRFLSLAL
jgi:hypothetical protein